MKNGFIFALALTLFAVGCSSQSEDAGSTSSSSTTTTASASSGSTGETTTGGSTAAGSFSEVQALLSQRCVGCHGQSNPKEGINLTSYDSIMKGGEHGPIVVANDPENSVIVQVLRGSHGKKQMPLNAAPLDDADIKKVEAWISAGAKSE